MNSNRTGSLGRLSLSACAASALLAGIAIGRTAAAAPIKVACIGEHTTHSDLFSGNRETQPPGMQEYPRKLQDLMGPGYDVRNFGDCCASVYSGYPSSETHPYVSGSNYKNSVAFAPDIVVIGSWGRHDWGKSAMTALPGFTIAKFQTGYEDLVSRYLALPKKPKIYVSTLIPILFGNDGPDNGYKTSPASDVVTAVAAKYGLPVVDLFTAFTGQTALFINPPLKDSEGEHTSDLGSTKIAQLVAAALKGAGTDGGVTTGPTDAGAGADSSPVRGSGGAGGQGAPGTGGEPATGTGGTDGGALVIGTGGATVSGSGGAAPSGSGGTAATGTGGVGANGAVGTVGESSGCACSTAAPAGERRPAGLLGSFVLMGLAVAASRARKAKSSSSGRADLS